MRGVLDIALFTLLWICFGVWPMREVISSNLQDKLWRRDREFDNKMISPLSSAIGVKNLLTAGTTGHCAAMCSQSDWCQSFFYQPSTDACHLHARVFKDLADTVNDNGVKYYKLETGCPTANGYNYDWYSRLCYKIHFTNATMAEAKTTCQGEGASLVTLDTPRKVQGMMAILITTPGMVNLYIHVGASRPISEWNTPWTSSSSFFQWEKTGQSMMPVNEYFFDGEPAKDIYQNCIDMGVFSHSYVNLTTFKGFADGYCTYQCYFVCEIDY